MSHPAHIILKTVITRPSGIEIALSVPIPDNAGDDIVSDRKAQLEQIKAQLESMIG